MKGYIQQTRQSFEELVDRFDKLDKSNIAHNIATFDLFKSGKKGEEKVLQKINELENGYQKDNLLFRIVKLYYENNNDIQTALKMADEIQNQDEKTRCLVHLANAVINNEGNLKLADEIIGKVKEDNNGYLEYYEKEKQNFY